MEPPVNPNTLITIHDVYTLSIAPKSSVLYNKNHEPLKIWNNEKQPDFPTKEAFAEFMTGKADYWLSLNLIYPDKNRWYAKEIDNSWYIFDEEDQPVPYPEELPTEHVAMNVLDSMRAQPKIIKLDLSHVTGNIDNGYYRTYYKFTVVITQPAKNPTLPELRNNMMLAAKAFFPENEKHWHDLIKHLPAKFTRNYGFYVSDLPTQYQIKDA